MRTCEALQHFKGEVKPKHFSFFLLVLTGELPPIYPKNHIFWCNKYPWSYLPRSFYFTSLKNMHLLLKWIYLGLQWRLLSIGLQATQAFEVQYINFAVLTFSCPFASTHFEGQWSTQPICWSASRPLREAQNKGWLSGSSLENSLIRDSNWQPIPAKTPTVAPYVY